MNPTHSGEQSLSPAELIARSQTSRGILRVYERAGLIEPSERLASGYRRYSAHTVDQLKAIRAAKELGFSLTEIAEMLGIGAPGMTRAKVRKIAADRVKLLDQRLAKLQSLREAFASFVADPDQAFDPECSLLLDFVAKGNEQQATGNRERAKRNAREHKSIMKSDQ